MTIYYIHMDHITFGEIGHRTTAILSDKGFRTEEEAKKHLDEKIDEFEKTFTEIYPDKKITRREINDEITRLIVDNGRIEMWDFYPGTLEV